MWSTSRRSPNIRITHWPSARFGKKHALNLAFFILFLGWSQIHSRGGLAETILKVVNGQVKEISSGKEELILSYRHPVTGREEKLGLKIDTGTSFNQGLHLGDFKEGDPVSVDYKEDPEGILRAVRINRVDTSGVPEEIAQFRH